MIVFKRMVLGKMIYGSDLSVVVKKEFLVSRFGCFPGFLSLSACMPSGKSPLSH